MKVLHILNEITFSGAEVMLRVAAPTFAANSLESHILSTGDNIGNYADILKEAGYIVHHIPFSKSPEYFCNVFSLIRHEKFNVVHIHPERAFFWHTMVTWASGVQRIFRTVHDVFLFSGYLKIKRKYQRLLARKLFGLIFISIGTSVKKIEKEYYNNLTIVIKNWIDEEYFTPPTNTEKIQAKRALGFRDGDIVIITVGTCNQKKDHYAVFNALSQINLSLQTPLKYLHRGTGPTRDDERKYSESIGVSSSTLFVDFINDVRSAYWASDIFVMTSGWEGLGNVILEAMYCGLPVILYNVLGMRDTLPEGVGGMLVEPDPTNLARAIKKLVLNPELRTQMGMDAYESVKRNFKTENSLEKLIGLYKGEKVRNLQC